MTAEPVEFTAGAVRLSGTLTHPDSPSTVPGLVRISGSGPSDRHNDGWFDPIVDHLVGEGIAVLAYDKRGAGNSSGSWPEATVDELAGDAAAAVAALQSHPAVGADRVGVFGHSEGGWVALRLAAQLQAPRHLILNSCPAVSFAESEIFAQTVAGLDPGIAADLMQELGAAARLGTDPEHGQRILAAHEGEPWHDAMRESGFVLDATTWSQLKAWVDYEPYDDLMQLTAPTLVSLGEQDPLVPVGRSVQRYEQTAAESGRLQRIAVFAGADHRLQTATGLAPGYLALLGGWCHEQSSGSSRPRQLPT